MQTEKGKNPSSNQQRAASKIEQRLSTLKRQINNRIVQMDQPKDVISNVSSKDVALIKKTNYEAAEGKLEQGQTVS